MSIIEIYTTAVSSLALVLAVVVVVMLGALTRPSARPARHIKQVTASFVFTTGLVITGGATIGSLIFSEAIGYTACELCWYQRIMLFPQVVIFATGLIWSARALMIPPLILSIVGAVIAAYHIGLQAFTEPGFVCATGQTVPCHEIYFQTFGFMSFPVLSLIVFVFLLVLTGFALATDSGSSTERSDAT